THPTPILLRDPALILRAVGPHPVDIGPEVAPAALAEVASELHLGLAVVDPAAMAVAVLLPGQHATDGARLFNLQPGRHVTGRERHFGLLAHALTLASSARSEATTAGMSCFMPPSFE